MLPAVDGAQRKPAGSPPRHAAVSRLRPAGDAVVRLSALLHAPLFDEAGARLGRIEDVIVRSQSGESLPRVTGLLTTRAYGRELFVPAARITRLAPPTVSATMSTAPLSAFKPHAGDVALRADVSGRSLINVDTASLVRARDVELHRVGGSWRLAGIDAGLAAALRHLLPRSLRRELGASTRLIAWNQLEPFVGRAPVSRVRAAHRRLARLHPAQIADLVEAASHDEGEEILEALEPRRLEADVFSELDETHQREFLRMRSDAEIARVLDQMQSNDAVQLLMEIDQERRVRVLTRLSSAQQAKVEVLLAHSRSTAGGLMNPDLIALPLGASVGEALEAVRCSMLPAAQRETIYLLSDEGRLFGCVTLPALISAAPGQTVAQFWQRTPAVPVYADLAQITQLMADFSLTMLPVVDRDGSLLGVLSVDDVLRLILPDGWRRRAALAGEH